MFKAVRCIFRSQSASRHLSQDTIYSVSSGYGKCGVSVIRISGPQTKDVLTKIARFDRLPQERKTYLRKIFNPNNGDFIDKSLVLSFKAPASFSGEDSCELHVHGGTAVIQATLNALSTLPGLRHAEAGEYTKRAFHNGKLDLTEVEGLADLIHAETEAQRKQALRQMNGELGRTYHSWRKILLKCVADVQAYIDFSEEENIEADLIKNVNEALIDLSGKMQRHLADNRCGQRLRDGVYVTIIGEPNVGKSSLINILSQKDTAIVSPTPGTTRDVLESVINLGGYPLLVSDTAGIRPSHDLIEQEGVRRAINRAESADLIVWMSDSPDVFNNNNGSLTESLTSLLRSQQDQAQSTEKQLFPTENLICVLNKIDLTNSLSENLSKDICRISCLTMNGIDEFTNLLTRKIKTLCENPNGLTSPSITSQRHRTHVLQAAEAIGEYFRLVDSDIVLASHKLNMSLREIGKITGQITTEEILDVIFRDFCIGK